MNDQPPHDLLAEQAVLGAMLLSPATISKVAEIITPAAFYQPNHTDIFDAILGLVAEGDVADPITVAHEMEKRGTLRRSGGVVYIHTLTASPPTPDAAPSYARVVFDKWRQRTILAAGNRFKELGFAESTCSEDVDALLAEADEIFRELGTPSRTGLMWDDLIEKWRDWQADPELGVIPTPWDELNTWLHGGVHKGQLIVVGGRPGDGKSISGLNIALEAAEKGHRSTVFSVEMDDLEVCSRLLAAGSYSKVGQIFSRRMDQDTHDRVEAYIRLRKGMPLEIVDQASITVEQIVAHCRIRRPDIIFVDYSQLIAASDSRASREQQVAHVTRSLKIAAKHLKMVVIVASQLNRGPTGREAREPLISDLRESGAAEQDGDVVILLHRPADEEGQVRLIVGKNRNGPTGIIRLTFRGALSRLG